MEAQQASNVMTESKPGPADTRKLRVAVVGIGWWSDVLADAALRSDAIDIVARLRYLRRGEAAPRAVAAAANDTIREELEEFAACIRSGRRPETDGWWASRNLAVVMAGIQSAREGRAIDVELVAAG
jgi:predicted dehydrogenase